MTPVIATFTLSGLAIILLITAKRFEMRRNKPFFIFKIISKSDEHIRMLYHKTLHWYSDSKDFLIFFLEKQLPVHSRNLMNKLIIFLRERREQYTGSMRDVKLLKKSDGISEFFKKMSGLEKGNGEIHDIYEDNSQNG